MTYTVAVRESIYRWRQSHREAYLEGKKRSNKTYYEKNREVLLAQKREKYAAQKEAKGI